MKKLSALAALCCAALSAQADVTLNPIFDDHMVLQREIPVSVYGAAEPGEKVNVAFAAGDSFEQFWADAQKEKRADKSAASQRRMAWWRDARFGMFCPLE